MKKKGVTRPKSQQRGSSWKGARASSCGDPVLPQRQRHWGTLFWNLPSDLSVLAAPPCPAARWHKALAFQTRATQGLVQRARNSLEPPKSCSQLHRKATLLPTGPAITTRGRTSQPTRARASPAFQRSLSHQSHHNRRMYTAHIGNIPRGKCSGDQKGMCCLGPRGGLLNKATSPRWEA